MRVVPGARAAGRVMQGLDSLSMLALVYVGLAVACAGLVHGTLGLGFPIVATPLVALVTGIKPAIVLVLPPTLTVVILSIVSGGSIVQTVRNWWRMPVWMFVGALVGTRVFILFDPAPLTLLLALVMLGYLALDSIGRAQFALLRRHPHAFAALFGFFGGFFEGAVNVSAPPLLVYFMSAGLAPATLVKALNLCFATAKSTQFGMLASAGGVPFAVWMSTVPFCAIGAGCMLAGARFRNRVPAPTYRRWLKQALFAMSVLLIVQFVLLMRGAS